MSELLRIKKLLQHTFDGPAWHGPSVMGVLNDCSAKHATLRIGSSHAIIGLVLHMTAWRTYVIRKLEDDHDFELSDAQNFPEGHNWKAAMTGLKDSQIKLFNLLDQQDDEILTQQVPGRKHNFYVLLHGIIQHDIYLIPGRFN